jgi:hypothetical protein
MAVRYNTSVIRDGLILYLDAANPKSYPGTGTTWFDLSNSKNNVTLYNGVTFDSSRKSFTFDGINDYAKTNGVVEVSGTNKVTVMYFLRVKAYPTPGINFSILHELGTNFNSIINCFIGSYADNSISQDYQIFASLRGNAGYNIAIYDKTLLNDLDWHNICFIHDTSQTSKENLIYTEGTIQKENFNPISGFDSNNTQNFASGQSLYFASRAGTQGFSNVEIAAILVYNRTLTAQEINNNFTAMRGRYDI